MDVEVGTAEALCTGSLKSHPVANEAMMLGPITPDPNREKGDTLVSSESPSSMASPASLNVDCIESPTIINTHDVGVNSGSPADADGNGLSTPKQVVFDPFAPGPDDMALAPICKKVTSMSKPVTVRRLSFDDPDEKICNGHVSSLSEALLLKSVYNNVLEVIFSKQAEDFLAENIHSPCSGDNTDGPKTLTSSPQLSLIAENGHSCCSWDNNDGPKTPTSSPQKLSLLAETCPAAPMKALLNKPRNIEPGLRRKLEF